MIQCGIVGWKNSGKTYLAQKLINYFSKKNYIVASIKHAHHDFDIDKPGTDSYLHRTAGAKQVIVSSSKRWAKIMELDNSPEKKLNDIYVDFNNFICSLDILDTIHNSYLSCSSDNRSFAGDNIILVLL